MVAATESVDYPPWTIYRGVNLLRQDDRFWGGELKGMRDWNTCKCPRYRFVDPNGDDADSGLTPDHAWKTIRSSLYGKVQMVKAGTYTGGMLYVAGLVYGYGGEVVLRSRVYVGEKQNGLCGITIDGDGIEATGFPGLDVRNHGCVRRCTIQNWNSGGITSSYGAALNIYAGSVEDCTVHNNIAPAESMYIGRVEGGSFYEYAYWDEETESWRYRNIAGYVKNTVFSNNTAHTGIMQISFFGAVKPDCTDSGNTPALVYADLGGEQPDQWPDVYPP
jgi:hypothetical protein